MSCRPHSRQNPRLAYSLHFQQLLKSSVFRFHICYVLILITVSFNRLSPFTIRDQNLKAHLKNNTLLLIIWLNMWLKLVGAKSTDRLKSFYRVTKHLKSSL